MKENKILQLDPSSVHVRLGMCAAALAGTAAAVPSTQATLITFSTPINVPATFAGVYINLLTGATGGSGAAVPGWDFNPYAAAGLTQLGFYWAAAPAGGVAATAATGPYLDLAPGTVVGPGSTYTRAITGTTGSPFLMTGTHILGFAFTNENTGLTNYGYLTMTTTTIDGLPTTFSPSTTRGGLVNGPSIPDVAGFPATITSWTFDNTGAAITVVPEPATAALLTIGALAAGAVGLRKWRRQRAA